MAPINTAIPPIWKQIALRQEMDDDLYDICRRSLHLDPKYVVGYQEVAAECSRETRRHLWDMMGWSEDDT
jgi:hypothetical protein